MALHHKSGCALNHAFKAGTLSAQEITNHFLQRIEQENEKLGAFLSIYRERAMRQAEVLDQKRKEGKHLGKLAGIPIAIKDNIHVNGQITSCGSRFLSNYRAPFDATVTRLIEEEGGIILGKTNMDEFAMGSSNENSAFMPCRNPWDLDKVPGGSSGGSCAAVAARLVPIALGSDTGGSIRQPASFCGLQGFKPTYGRVSRYGLVAFGSSLDQIGPMAHASEDIGRMMEVMGRHCDADGTSLPEAPQDYAHHYRTHLDGVKIGIPHRFLEGLKPEAKALFDQACEKLKELGAELVPVELDILNYSIAVYYILATAEASTNLARFDGIRYGNRSREAKTLEEVYDYSRQEGFGTEVKRRILLGTYVLSAGYQEAYYKKAQQVRTLIIRAYQKAFQSCHLIAMPTAPETAFGLGAMMHDPLTMYLQDIYTIGANLAGIPAISTPAGLLNGLPFGLQLLGPQKADVAVCAAAHAFSKATTYEALLPKLFAN